MYEKNPLSNSEIYYILKNKYIILPKIVSSIIFVIICRNNIFIYQMLKQASDPNVAMHTPHINIPPFEM